MGWALAMWQVTVLRVERQVIKHFDFNAPRSPPRGILQTVARYCIGIFEWLLDFIDETEPLKFPKNSATGLGYERLQCFFCLDESDF